MSYIDYFGFREDPFTPEPDPRFLFLSKVHEEAIAHIQYGIGQNRGFIMLTGDAGTGKTVLVNHVIASAEPGLRTNVISRPGTDALELLKRINNGYGLDVKGRQTHKGLMDGLNEFLLYAHHGGEKALLIIDDAHLLGRECLEFVRLLSNLETDTEKLLLVALVGRPELKDEVKSDSLRQLNQRIAVRYVLGGLDIDETGRYLNHRLHAAGAFGLGFPANSIGDINRSTGGIPGRINSLAAKVLMATYENGALTIEAGAVRKAIGESHVDAHVEPIRIKRTTMRLVIYAILLVGVVGLIINIPGVLKRLLGMFGLASPY